MNLRPNIKLPKDDKLMQQADDLMQSINDQKAEWDVMQKKVFTTHVLPSLKKVVGTCFIGKKSPGGSTIMKVVGVRETDGAFIMEDVTKTSDKNRDQFTILERGKIVYDIVDAKKITPQKYDALKKLMIADLL